MKQVKPDGILKNESLLIVCPAPVRYIDDGLYMESQALNGLQRWADNFSSITATYVCYPESMADRLPGVKWERVDSCSGLDSVTVLDFPYAYEPLLHLKYFRQVRSILQPLIARSRYLSFAIGGYFGDWGSVAASLASRQGRRFAVWTDRVESRVIRIDAKSKRNPIRRLYGIAYSWFVHVHERRIIRSAAIGLFHGADTYMAYSGCMNAAFKVENVHLTDADRLEGRAASAKGDSLIKESGNAFLVHDTHLTQSQRDYSVMENKEFSATIDNPRPLRVGYAGRAAGMKAPIDWLTVIRTVRDRGGHIKAVWLGDGPLLEAMRAFVKEHGMEEIVEIPGFVSDREKLIKSIREWDVLLFTHITPESPRVLLEAMVSATPIVGYESHYARDLVAGFGERFLVPIGQVSELADRLIELDNDRPALAELMRTTFDRSDGFSDTAVFKHRSDLIKRYLG